MALIPKADEFVISSQFAQRTLSYGLGLGFLGSLLFFDIQRVGLPLTLWLTGFAMAACSLALRFRPGSLKVIITWSLVALAAGTMLIVSLNPVSLLTMLATILLSAVIVTMEFRGTPLRDSSVQEFASSCLRLPLLALTACFALLGKADLRGSARDPALLSYLRGLLIALPLALLFGALFSAADSSFERVFDGMLQFFGPDMPEHLFIALLVGWLGTGLLTSIGSIVITPNNSSKAGFRLGEIEVTVVMSVLLGLFLLFIFLQLPYLFGGRETIESTTGLTLSAYARRGFFELVAVSCIALLLLIVLGSTTSNKGRFRPLAIGLIACLFLIMLSASQRLLLYMDGFGLTLARLSAAVFMIWVALCLLLFVTCLLRGSEKGFVPGAVYSALLLAFSLALLSPPKIVAHYNIEQAKRSNTTLDVFYLNSLGMEVIPILLNNFDLLESGRCWLTWQWSNDFELEDSGDGQSSDWRNWNLAYSRAEKALRDKKDELPTPVRFNGNLPPGIACIDGNSGFSR